MTSEDIKLAISVGMPSLMVLVGILINNSRLSDLRNSIEKRFDDLSRFIDARFHAQDEKLYRVEQVIDARLKHLEERLGSPFTSPAGSSKNRLPGYCPPDKRTAR